MGQGAAGQQFLTDHTEILELLVVEMAGVTGRWLPHGRAVIRLSTIDGGDGVGEYAMGDLALVIDQCLGLSLKVHVFGQLTGTMKPGVSRWRWVTMRGR